MCIFWELFLHFQFFILQLQYYIRLLGQLFTVSDDDDAFVIFVGGAAQDVDDVGGSAFVQVAGRLVRQDDRCMRDESSTDRHTLLLTARKFHDVTVNVIVVQAHGMQGFVGGLGINQFQVFQRRQIID